MYTAHHLGVLLGLHHKRILHTMQQVHTTSRHCLSLQKQNGNVLENALACLMVLSEPVLCLLLRTEDYSY